MNINKNTFETPAIVNNISAYHVWQDGKNTGVQEGMKVDALCEDGFERVHLPVKIPVMNLPITEKQISDSKATHKPIFVIFDGLEIIPYVNGDTKKLAYSARATKLTVVESGKV